MRTAAQAPIRRLRPHPRNSKPATCQLHRKILRRLRACPGEASAARRRKNYTTTKRETKRGDERSRTAKGCPKGLVPGEGNKSIRPLFTISIWESRTVLTRSVTVIGQSFIDMLKCTGRPFARRFRALFCGVLQLRLGYISPSS